MQSRRVERDYRGEKITAEVRQLDEGAFVLVTGGSRTHIGAVSSAGYAENFSFQFPGHRDEVISRTWARQLSEAWGEPVTVACGIHYDGVGREEIDEIVALCGRLLQEVQER